VVFIAAQDYLAKQSPEYWTMGIGVLLIVIVMFARGGMLGLLDRARAKFGGKPS
jgi:branched-chain amino acid transport system permease protein